jgi:LmbE family N-acetylglucosaminyl deacetylase
MDLQPGPALFLQPHYDDVALSCGGTVAAWAAAGCEPRMVTVFASELVDGMVGEFAGRKHSRWNVADLDAVPATRRGEDERAATVLGCSVRWLGLPDAIYRGDRYTSDASLYGAPHPEELALPEHLAEELLLLPEWRPGSQVFVSLGVGDHVDHQLVFEAGRRLAQLGVHVWAYEDLPYGIHTPQGLASRLAKLAGAVQGPVVVPVAATIDRKLDAIASYASQVPVIFRFTDDFRGAIRAHALAVGGRAGPAERFWRVVG